MGGNDPGRSGRELHAERLCLRSLGPQLGKDGGVSKKRTAEKEKENEKEKEKETEIDIVFLFCTNRTSL